MDRAGEGYNPAVMQPRHALFLISALLFACGIGFVVVGARTSRGTTASVAETLQPIGSVTHIMRGIVDPAADVVFNAVSTTVTSAGVEEKAPSSQQEWDRVSDSAAALAESGNLLLVGSRAVDHGDWTKWSRKLVDAGVVALRAAEAKDSAGVFAAGEAIYEACDNCHKTYRRTE